MPTLFISIAHVPYRDAERPDCLILPSSVHHFPTGVQPGYGHTMNDSLALLQHLEYERVHVSMAVGVTMKGRWYKPRDPASPSSYNLFQSCTNFSGSQDVIPASVCAGGNQYSVMARNYHFDQTLLGGFTHDPNSQRVLVFDSKRGIALKFCDGKQYYLVLTYGVAAYDIEYDVSPDACPLLSIYGPYSRVNTLTNLRDFLGYNYTGVASKAECDRLA
ncbi:uncharacterized protein LOC144101059 [Amblyomma americanum]